MVFTNRGLSVMVNFLSSGTGSTATRPTHLEIGSHTITPSATDTALTGSFYRLAWTANSVTNPTKNKYEALVTSAEANGETMKAIGVFNASSGGDLFAEQVFTAITKDATKDIQFNVEFVHADA